MAAPARPPAHPARQHGITGAARGACDPDRLLRERWLERRGRDAHGGERLVLAVPRCPHVASRLHDAACGDGADRGARRLRWPQRAARPAFRTTHKGGTMRFVAFGLMLAVAACAGDAADDAAPGQDAPAAQASAGATGGGSIGGTIAFTGAVPANPAIDMAQEAKCRAKHANAPTNPLFVVKDGK